MYRVLGATLILMTAVGCARVQDSVVNPFNWFGRSSAAPVATAEATPQAVNPLIPRGRASIFRSEEEPEIYLGTLVADIDELVVETTPGGAVVRATGTASSLGAFDVRLVPNISETDGDTLSYEFRAVQLPSGRGAGTDTARGVTVAIDLTNQELAGIRTVRVSSASNVRTARP